MLGIDDPESAVATHHPLSRAGSLPQGTVIQMWERACSRCFICRNKFQGVKDIPPHSSLSKTLTQFHTAPTKLHRYPRRLSVGCADQYWGLYMSKNLLAGLG